MMETKQFVVIGIVLALLVGLTAVFVASGDPDGLESSALVVSGDKTLTSVSPEDADAEEAVGHEGSFEYEAPMPDYSMGDAMGKTGEVVAIIVGIFIALLLGFGASRVVAKNN